MANLRANTIAGSGGSGNNTKASLYLDGSNEYLSFADNADFAMGTGDLTAECWFYVESNVDYRSIIDARDAAGDADGWMIGVKADGNVYVYAAGWLVITTGAEGTINTWHHVAYVRKDGTHTLYLDGVSKATSTTSKDYTTQKFAIGTTPYSLGGEEFKGYISSVNLVKGSALYGANFDPYEVSPKVLSDTVLLCCNDSQKPEAYEVSPGVITPGGTPTPSKFIPSNLAVPTGVVFDGDVKINTQNVMYFPTGDTSQRGRGRGIFGGGYKSPFATADNLNSLEYFNIQSTGNAVDFGDRTVVMSQGMATVASSTRGVMMGGRGYNYPASPTSTSTDTIDYVTIATTANATDFGNLVHGSTYISAAGGNSTRGVLFRSSDGDMEYITIATTGNSVDTGSDSTVGRNTFSGSASQTRAFWAGGANPSGGAAIATIDYLEIASLGVPQDFGDLTFTGHNQAASSNTRGIIFTGGFPSAASNVINYITIASTGNATDFGDLPANITSHSAGSGVSNSIRAVRCGGSVAPTSINRIDYVTISTTGNAQDFGDLITIRQAASGFSDSHGGL